MIVRHIPMKLIKKSSFSGLIEYLTSSQGKHERVGEIQITNCHSNQIEWAVSEVEATQFQNQRAKGDRTYHLLISFPTGEVPSSDVLNDIENKVCASLGFSEHQRISVIHHDTDNFHIHVGINKIHPINHTLHEPYLAYKKLAKIATALEIEHGLQVTNHIAHKTNSENRANDMEHHTGVESLLNWIKQSCTDKIGTAQSWNDIHNILHEHGLEIRERGNGLIIINSTGISVKASSVSRDFSKNKLENKLGIFQSRKVYSSKSKQHVLNRPFIAKIGCNPPPRSRSRLHRMEQLESLKIDNGCRYESLPLYTKFNTDALFAQYQSEQDNVNRYRKKEWSLALMQTNKLIESAKRSARLKRATIKLCNGSGVNKKALYALVSRTLRRDIMNARLGYIKDKQAIYSKFQRRTWADWLKIKATEGDLNALAALRARDSNRKSKGDCLSGDTKKEESFRPNLSPDNITKKGTIIYRVGTFVIRDDGDFLKISRGTSQEGLEIVLKMAMDRYGQCITVNGSDLFKTQIVQTVAKLKLNITFDDPGLEQYRQNSILSLITEKNNERHEQPINEHNRSNRRRHEAVGSIKSINIARLIR